MMARLGNAARRALSAGSSVRAGPIAVETGRKQHVVGEDGVIALRQAQHGFRGIDSALNIQACAPLTSRATSSRAARP